MLLNIASSAQLPETESIEIAKVLHKHYDDEDARGEFFDVLVALLVLSLLRARACAYTV